MPARLVGPHRMTDATANIRDTGCVLDDTTPNSAVAFEHAATSLSLSDSHGRILQANLQFWKLFGYDPGASLNVGMLSRQTDQDWTLSYLTRLVTGDLDEFRTVKRFVRADGTEFDGQLAINALREDGQCTGLIASIEPVDVRPTIDNARMRKLLQHAAGTLTLVNLEGNVIETSGRYRDTLGYPPEFWEGRTILDLVVPEDLPLVLGMRDQLLADPEEPITNDLRVQGADRSIETLQVTALNKLTDPDLTGIILSTRNVTLERQITRAVAQMRDEAITEAEQRSHLLATVSHELRNPLHAMSGIVELLESDDSLADSPRELAGSLLRQLRHLTSVTDDLLDTARLDGGRFELRPAPVVIRDLVDDVMQVAHSAAAGRLQLEQRVGDDVPHAVTIDPARLQQVLSNLLGNSVKFTEHGSVRLTVSTLDEAPSDRQLVFEVRDTGVGIPADQTDEIFLPFSTARTGGDRRGAGLGLTIVRQLVDALGGTVELQSELDSGSVFTVRVPSVDAITAVSAALSDSPAPRARVAVLVIEDTPVNQQLAQHQLDRLEMNCVIADSAEHGLDHLGERDFDVILMDHQLPGMNGRDATREIRRRGIATPIIGITASSTAADERACLEAGMNAFLPKPVGLDRLAAALEQVLRARPISPGTEADAPPAATDHAALDVSALEQLADELGDRAIVAGLVRTFLGELDARESGISGDDATLAARQAHTLKSSAKLLGAVRLAQICAAAETDPSARHEIASAAAAARVGLTAWLDSGDEQHPGTTTAGASQ